MSFSSITFLFFFLPVSILLYAVCPERMKPAILALLSIMFYSWGSPAAALLLLLSCGFNYASGLLIDELFFMERPRTAKAAFIFSVAVNVGYLAAFKYTPVGATGIGLPLGISFYTFSAISYLADVYTGKTEPQRNPLLLFLYIALFTKVGSGPIALYSDMSFQLQNHYMSAEDFGPGFIRFLTGLFKKVILADQLGAVFAAIRGMEDRTVGIAWLGLLIYGLQLYYDFSGYSDMAIGLSRIFGFYLKENFEYPYTATSVSQFWRKWHISLGSWFREYVYIPLGGNRCSTARQVFNLLTVWLLTGIWHGSTLNFPVWGLYMGLIIIVERFLIGDKFDKVSGWIRVLGMNLMIHLGWALFFSADFKGAAGWYGQMVGIGASGFWDSRSTMLVLEYLLLILVALVLCGPLVKLLHDKLAFYDYKAGFAVSAVLYIALFIYSVSCLVGGTYATFLYSKF